MWPGKSGGDFVALAVMSRRVTCGVVRRGEVLPDTVHTASLPLDHADGLVALGEALSKMTARLQVSKPKNVTAVRVVISDAWLSVMSLPWSADLHQRGEALPLVRRRMQDAGFGLQDGDALAFDDGPFAEPVLAVAYPEWIMSALREWAQALEGSLSSVLPLSVSAWQAVSVSGTRPDALAVLDDGWVILTLGKGRPQDVCVREVPTATESSMWPGSLQQIWQRLLIRQPDRTGLNKLFYASTDVIPPGAALMRDPPGWQLWRINEGDAAHTSETPELSLMRATARCSPSMLDAVGAVRSYSWMATALAVALLISVGLAALQGFQAMEARQRLAMKDAASRANTPVWQSVASLSTAELKRLQAVNKAVSGLNLPVSRLLSALQPPKDIDVGILSLNLNAAEASQAIRVVAEAPTQEDMLRYIDFLKGRGPYVEARLKQHERSEGSSGVRYLFTLDVAWNR